ncbi:MAG: PqqD family protein [Actinomycetota bacterium]|nr:PqqD family protein [Actinomycetota bacterium]
MLSHATAQWALAGAEAVVHVPAFAATHVLDATATVLWQCLDGESPLQLVFADIAAAFDVPLQRVASDCLPVLGTWLQAGLAVQVPAAPPMVTPTPVPTLTPVPKPPSGSGRAWRRLVDPPNT